MRYAFCLMLYALVSSIMTGFLCLMSDANVVCLLHIMSNALMANTHNIFCQMQTVEFLNPITILLETHMWVHHTNPMFWMVRSCNTKHLNTFFQGSDNSCDPLLLLHRI